MVIHLQGKAKKFRPLQPCQKCGNKRVINGEIAKVCVDCFLDGEILQFYDYGVPFFEFTSRKRGTCSRRHSKPAGEVIKAAVDFLEGKGFGRYDMFANNCEDFAVYCETGTAESHQVMGHIRQLTSMSCIGVPVAGAYLLSKAITAAKRRR
ncbi:hypothetical protein HRI_001629000 [Hibiscus trionum]|nr:hypothetical protein HRI_001629000 [Hibiscus trionum]